MKNKLILIAVSLASLAACQGDLTSQLQITQDNAVINGSKVTSRNTAAAKSLVFIELLGANGAVRTFCSAALVGTRTVLTAAHCFDPKHVKTFTGFQVVFANQIGIKNSLVRRGLVFKKHPEYNTNGVYNYDIAMAVFEGTAPAGFIPAVMDSDTRANYGGNTLYVYGYGRSQDYTGKPNENLRHSVGVLHRGVVQVQNDYNQLGDLYLLKSSSASHICQGDSGGPQFYSQNGVTKIVGVTSANFGKVLENGQHSCREHSQAAKVAPNYAWFKREERLALGR
ncbi:S1 family peptidase [Bdellovibrio sp. HCB290]|uniref:S1 family peptidase n=1 Tax=Bdellovibrio sp. HCB290 TaxID=3394356 RepID=UPI0039B47823